MIGYKNEFFEVISNSGTKNKNRSILWECRCKCGKITFLPSYIIKNKSIKSCGCSRKGLNKGNKFGVKHGLTALGKAYNPLYTMRNRIITRCYNAKPSDFPYYQGKGITVHEEWIQNPRSFYEWGMANGWKSGLTIDRINPNGNYEPNNCMFSSISDNLKNMHTWRSVKKPLAEIVRYCFRCKCMGSEIDPCKFKKGK